MSQLASLLIPDAPGLLEIAGEIHRQRSDLQTAYPEPESLEFARWVAVNGRLEYPDQLARFYPPLPPEALRHAASGGESDHSHLYTGTEDLQVLTEIVATFDGQTLGEFGSILDFGCGCGRLLRWLAPALSATDCVGTDIRADSIAWCQQSLPGRYQHTEMLPPLDLPDDSFDLVYAISVFSHLDRHANLAWLRELVRVCRPGGLLLLSTHGPFSLFVIARSPAHQSLLNLEAAQARTLLRRIHTEQFLFAPRPADSSGSPDGVQALYDQAFFTAEFVAAEWANYVEVLGHIPVVQGMFQDYFVLRAR